jgi:hypothetical protein
VRRINAGAWPAGFFFRRRVVRVGTFLIGVLLATAAWGQTVDLEWRPDAVTVTAGETVELGVYAVGETETPVCAIGVIFEWTADSLVFMGAIGNPPEEYQWMATYFPVGEDGFDGLNDSWLDGDAYWVALADWGDPFVATPEGTLVAVFEFTAYDDGAVAILPDVGGYAETVVMDAEVVGQNIVGDLGSATVTVADPPPPIGTKSPSLSDGDVVATKRP